MAACATCRACWSPVCRRRLARLRTLVRDRFEAWERAVASADRCVRAVLRPLRCVDPPWWWWWLR